MLPLHTFMILTTNLTLPIASTAFTTGAYPSKMFQEMKAGQLPASGWGQGLDVKNLLLPNEDKLGRKLMLRHRCPHVGIVFLLVVSGRSMCQQFMRCADVYPVGWFLPWFMDQHEKLINI